MPDRARTSSQPTLWGGRSRRLLCPRDEAVLMSVRDVFVGPLRPGRFAQAEPLRKPGRFNCHAGICGTRWPRRPRPPDPRSSGYQ
jgi:hypothetical protein